MITSAICLIAFLIIAAFGYWILSVVPPDTTFYIVAGTVILFGLAAVARLWKVEWYDFQKQFWVKKG